MLLLIKIRSDLQGPSRSNMRYCVQKEHISDTRANTVMAENKMLRTRLNCMYLTRYHCVLCVMIKLWAYNIPFQTYNLAGIRR